MWTGTGAHVAEQYPGSAHVIDLGLDRASDRVIGRHADEHDFAIVTKDADFVELAEVPGSTLRVIWIRLGNCTTEEIEAVLRKSRDLVLSLQRDEDVRVLLLR